MSDSEALVSTRKRIPAIWIVPIVAVVLGLWMVYYTISTEGPSITIRFNTADGIEAGKTKVKSRNVELGVVESVTLTEDLENVIVTAKIEREAEDLLRSDSQFWVVRARIGVGGISGLGTLLSGGYIELDPGTADDEERDFIGLEEPPVTKSGTAGIKFTLLSARAGSVDTGDPVLHRGFTVGRIESTEFDLATERMRYEVFVYAPYDELVRTDSRFWNASGLSISVTAEGISVGTGSLETLLTGGVEFASHESFEQSLPIETGAVFTLFPDQRTALEEPFEQSVQYVVAFDQSVKGLAPGASVELRGIPIGRVLRIMLHERALQPQRDQSIPVLIKLEPGRMRLNDDESGVARLRDGVKQAVDEHLFATLQTSNLLTGRLVVAFDFYPEEPAGELGEFNGIPTLPTKSTGLAQIEQKIASILDQIQAMPLTNIGNSADNALVEFSATMKSTRSALERIEALLAKEDTQEIPGSVNDALAELQRTLNSFSDGSPMYERINRTLVELNQTLKSVDELARTLEDQPSSLIFSIPREPDPEPRGDE